MMMITFADNYFRWLLILTVVQHLWDERGAPNVSQALSPSVTVGPHECSRGTQVPKCGGKAETRRVDVVTALY